MADGPYRRRDDRRRRGHPLRSDLQSLAISLMAGEVTSLLLSRMAVPVLYFMAKRPRAYGTRSHRSDPGGRGLTARGRGFASFPKRPLTRRMLRTAGREPRLRSP